MTISDPIADMLTRIRNSIMAKHDSVVIPSSKTKLAMIKILKKEGFISDFELLRGKPARSIKVHLKYGETHQPAITNLERASKPGLRLYMHSKEIPRVYGGVGIAIVSTSKGVMTGHQAWKQGVGGELLCYVW